MNEADEVLRDLVAPRWIRKMVVVVVDDTKVSGMSDAVVLERTTVGSLLDSAMTERRIAGEFCMRIIERREPLRAEAKPVRLLVDPAGWVH